jgi:inorganic pyrophosphatase
MELPATFVNNSEMLVHAVIETPKGSRNKYAYQEASGLFLLKKILPAGTAFPLDFGFIPGTRAEDGDPLDVLVITEQASYPGCLMQCRPIGIIKGEQRKQGSRKYVRNDRVLAVPDASTDFANLKRFSDLSKELRNDLSHFFMYYNSMEGGTYRMIRTGGAVEALSAVKSAIL